MKDQLIDFERYTQIVVGMSGGKDSTATALYMQYESGIPQEKIRYVFFDTGNEDPLLYAYMGFLNNILKIETVKPKQDFYEISKNYRRFPSRMARFCTRELKIDPKHELLANLVDKGDVPLNCTGVRHAEGDAINGRGDALQLEMETFRYNSKNYIVETYHPILHFTLENVWDIHRKYLSVQEVVKLIEADTMSDEIKRSLITNYLENGVPCNPLYVMGSKRVGCYPCINSDKKTIKAVSKYRPEKIEMIREAESAIAKNRKGIETYSPFFAPKTVPQRFRSKRVIEEDGTVTFVATIDDVVSWSKTKHGGKELDIEDEIISMCQIGRDCE